MNPEGEIYDEDRGLRDFTDEQRILILKCLYKKYPSLEDKCFNIMKQLEVYKKYSKENPIEGHKMDFPCPFGRKRVTASISTCLKYCEKVFPDIKEEGSWYIRWCPCFSHSKEYVQKILKQSIFKEIREN